MICFRRRGTSLLETVLATALLGLILLAVLGTVLYALRGVQHAAKADEAVGTARQVLDLIRVANLPATAPINDAPGDRIPLEAPPFDTDFAAGTGFTRNLQMVRQESDPANYGYDLFLVTVKLFWEERGAERSLTLEGLHRAP